VSQAARTHNPIRGNGKERRSIAIRFFPNGAANPVTVYDPHSDVASVTRTGQSAYLVTLNYPVKRILSMLPAVQLAALADAGAQCGATSTTEGTVNNLAVPIRVFAGGAAAAEIAANADNSISLDLEVELA
jgi:hypothetical protein